MAMELGNIGITGASGFLGKSLCGELDIQGYSYSIFSGKLGDRDAIEKFFIEHNISTLIHLAGISVGSSKELLEINLQGTHNLLEIGVKHGLKKIIFSSSGAVYGNTDGSISLEDTDCKPTNCYGLSKFYAETSIQYFARNHSLSYNILRFSNIYGPTSTNGVIAAFRKGIKEKKQINITGTGEEKRDFLHIDDVVSSIILSMKYKENNIFNISSSCNLSLNQVVNEFEKKYDFEVIYSESVNSLKNLHLDYAYASKLLGYKPKHNTLEIN